MASAVDSSEVAFAPYGGGLHRITDRQGKSNTAVMVDGQQSRLG